MKDFKPIIFVALGIIAIWFLFHDSGGLLGSFSDTTGFSNNRTSQNSFESKDVYKNILGSSVFAGKVELRNGGTRNDDRDREYVEIRATDDIVGNVTISGWTLRNATRDRNYVLPEAPRIAYPFDKLAVEPVTLTSDERAYVVTGFSPINTSFKANKCAGYFQNNNSFHPSLSHSCPRPEEDEILKRFGLDDNEECIDFLSSISRCTDYNGVPQFDDDDSRAISRRCEDYIREEVTYEGCVRNNITTPDFFGSKWYLYLGVHFTIDEIWKDGNTILLLDHSGKVVDEISI